MKIALLTDAWLPQTSGVVTTMTRMREGLTARGHEVFVIHPGMFRTVPCPSYPQIRLALLPGRKMAKMLDEFEPDAIHIPVEGPIGVAGRNYCVKRGLPFTTTFTTKFPEYIEIRFGIPARYFYRAMKWFHGKAETMMVATQSLKDELTERGFNNMKFWGRGVNTDIFYPLPKEKWPKELLEAPRPISISLGRVAPEKNLDAWLGLDLPGTKVVLGDGPAISELKKKYPGVCFTGHLALEDLPRYLSAADVFVFPSLTDTFGIVMIEAMACGLPVAAYPVVGPKDVLINGETGVVDDNLRTAIDKALVLDKNDCIARAKFFTWERSLDQFESNLAPIKRAEVRKAG
ncbi:MAG: glycosyltransferase family 1 protein [Planctomycetes bacterium]|nr:glycosyltransferase family 1 protein [Planctomycetota bacterium]